MCCLRRHGPYVTAIAESDQKMAQTPINKINNVTRLPYRTSHSREKLWKSRARPSVPSPNAVFRVKWPRLASFKEIHSGTSIIGLLSPWSKSRCSSIIPIDCVNWRWSSFPSCRLLRRSQYLRVNEIMLRGCFRYKFDSPIQKRRIQDMIQNHWNWLLIFVGIYVCKDLFVMIRTIRKVHLW